MVGCSICHNFETNNGAAKRDPHLRYSTRRRSSLTMVAESGFRRMPGTLLLVAGHALHSWLSLIFGGLRVNAHLVRRAHAADYPAIRTLLESEDLPNEDVTVESIPRFFVASVADGSLIGCVAIEQYGTDALLRSLAVADGARREGLGRTLVAAAEQDAIAHGVRRLFLLTTTAADYFSGIGYHKYERAVAPGGIQSTSQFASLCPASATCMAKTL